MRPPDGFDDYKLLVYKNGEFVIVKAVLYYG